MSLALAEILLKQSGDSSLDRARSQHRHHGLEFRAADIAGNAGRLEEMTDSLMALPLIKSKDEGFGTFELWHRSCREMPLAGNVTTVYPNGGITSGFRALMWPSDERLVRIPSTGISLTRCLKALPGMVDFWGAQGVYPELIRGNLVVQESIQIADPTQTFTATIHPGIPTVLSDFFDNVIFYPNAVDRINFMEFPSGGIISWIHNSRDGAAIRYFPNGTNFNRDGFYCWPTIQPLNEFGYIYVALFICGNYARYYPDRWLYDVEKNTLLALAIEEFIKVAENRLPLLSLSEMTRMYHVPAA